VVGGVGTSCTTETATVDKPADADEHDHGLTTTTFRLSDRLLSGRKKLASGVENS
jgi:hypothetical protein